MIESTKKYTKDKTITLEFYRIDKKGNQCDIVVDLPVDLEVPNLTYVGEEVRLSFTCTKGDLKKGNTVTSITRVN